MTNKESPHKRTPSEIRRLLREIRRIAIAPAILWIMYLVVVEIFDASTEHRGLVSPDELDPGLIILGVGMLVLRIIAIFVLPAVVTYRVSARLLCPPKKT